MTARLAALAASVIKLAPAIAREGMGIAGLAMIATGAGLAWLPAGLMVGGIELVALAYLFARRT